jgi:hypothetical protein
LDYSECCICYSSSRFPSHVDHPHPSHPRHQIYYVVLSLGRFNLYANSYGFLAMKARRNFYWKLEVTGVAFFWTWFGALLWGLPSWRMRLAYLLVSHIVTSPVHVQVCGYWPPGGDGETFVDDTTPTLNRSFSHTLLAPPMILVPPNPSSLVSSGQRWTSYAHPL